MVNDLQQSRLETYNTVILAIATLAVAWCSYQAALWNGIQTFCLADSNKYGRLAQQNAIQAGQKIAMDEAVMITFMDAVLNKNQQRIDYMLQGTGELAPVMSAWLAGHNARDTNAPLHPMATPAYQQLIKNRMQESEKMSKTGAEFYEKANKANRVADNYTMFTVLFSMVMFLGAITTKLVRTQPKVILTILAALICIGVLLIVIFSMPVAHKG